MRSVSGSINTTRANRIDFQQQIRVANILLDNTPSPIITGRTQGSLLPIRASGIETGVIQLMAMVMIAIPWPRE
jgi:hypothetical protein